MASANILVVEDESLVAKDIQNRLKKFGYNVAAIASSGEEAIKKANESFPDLVLMDIRLKGKIDGIQAAKQINHNLNIPVIYLTANADDSTLERAKMTDPYAYILKPFKEKELQTTIEITLNKHQTEKKLKQSEQWLNTVLRSIGDGVITSDRHGTITFINTVAESLTGWKQEEAFGKNATEVFNITHETTRVLLENPISQALHIGTIVSVPEETLLITKNGAEIPIDDSAAPIKDDKGNITGAVLVFRDITERKQAKETRQKQLEQERLVAQLEKLNELKDDFLSTVSHELRTPISNMKMAIQMLKASPSVERSQRYLEILQTECNREMELINDLLDLQRLEAAAYPFYIGEAINLKNWLPVTIEPFRVRTQEREQILRINLPPDLPTLISDSASLERILAELLNNACKYTFTKGEIILSVSHNRNNESSCPVEVISSRPVNYQIKELNSSTYINGLIKHTGEQTDKEVKYNSVYTIFTISNQAEISATELPRIFEKFYRVPKADRWKQGGTGLGLALVQKLVDHLQGTIQVESRNGWTTFTLQIPNLSYSH